METPGYAEPITVPAASRELLEEAVSAAVRGGSLWLINGAASFWLDEILVGHALFLRFEAHNN